MKKLILVFALVAAGSASALHSAFKPFAWEPVVFDFTSDPARDGMEDMKASGDKTLSDMQKAIPSFKDRFLRAFAFAGGQILNMQPLPGVQLGIFDDAASSDDRLHVTGAAIAHAVNNVRERIVEMLTSHFVTIYDGEEKYLYCEQNPSSTSELCEDGYAYDWAFVRRLFTRPSFMNAMCPVITQVAIWNLTGNPGHEADFTAFFDEMDRILTLYYNNGQWTDQILGTIHTPIGDRLTENLDRRYMDGGPDYIAAMQSCLKSVRAAYENQKPAYDPKSTAEIDAILKFKQVTIASKGEVIGVNTVDMDRGELYRLTRHFSADAYHPPSPDSEYYVYPETMVNMTLALNQIDPVYSYRLMTAEEHRLLRLQEEPVVKSREYAVVASQDYLRQGFRYLTYYAANAEDDDLSEIEDWEDQPVNLYLIVRVKK